MSTGEWIALFSLAIAFISAIAGGAICISKAIDRYAKKQGRKMLDEQADRLLQTEVATLRETISTMSGNLQQFQVQLTQIATALELLGTQTQVILNGMLNTSVNVNTHTNTNGKGLYESISQSTHGPAGDSD